MLIRKPADLRYSDVTPKQAYVNRRRFLAAGSAIVGAWALPTPAGATMKLNNVVKSAYKVDEKITPARRHHHLQQLLRIRHRQGRAVALRQHLAPVALAGAGGRTGGQAQDLRSRFGDEDRAARGAHLPPSLRRGVVDRGSVDRLPAGRAAQGRGAQRARPSTSRSRRFTIPSRCRSATAPASNCPTSKVCAWTKPCIRWRCSRSDCTARRCPTRTARRSGWWCRGSTVSRASSRS